MRSRGCMELCACAYWRRKYVYFRMEMWLRMFSKREADGDACGCDRVV